MSEILVIEDSPSIALLLKRRLERAGHSVELATTGEEALTGLDRAPPPDIVLSDLSMPGMSGLETLERIKDRVPGLPGILVTAWQVPTETRSAADEVVGKPIDFDHLLEAIDRLTP